MTPLNRKTFVFDLDDTVVNYFAQQHIAIQEHYGLDSSTFTTRETHNYLGITIGQWLKKIAEFRILEEAPPKVGAIELLTRLYSEGHSIYFVTCRGFHPRAVDVTLDWLNKYIPNYKHTVYAIQLHEHKADVIRKYITRVDYFFDDTLHHCKEVKEAFPDTRCVLINMPWNEAHTEEQSLLRSRLMCIDDLSHFDLELCEQGVISCEEQLIHWTAGNPKHNHVRNECCPDFSCCSGQPSWEVDVRERFLKAYQENDGELTFQMLMIGLGSLTFDDKVYVAGDSQGNALQ